MKRYIIISAIVGLLTPFLFVALSTWFNRQHSGVIIIAGLILEMILFPPAFLGEFIGMVHETTGYTLFVFLLFLNAVYYALLGHFAWRVRCLFNYRETENKAY
ncbi:MAG: hypothetical protein ABSG42_00345 [Nitrospirota bacterium]